MNQLTPNQRLLGFIGIGHMGSRIARRLLDHRYILTAYNRNWDAAEALVEHGATVADNVAELASQAGVILSCLANDNAVLSVYTDPQGVFEHARPGSVIIEMSTVFPLTSRELHRFGLVVGVKFLNTPISGSAQAAEQGALTLFCGGDKEVFHTTWKVAPCNQTGAAFLTDFEALSVTLDRRFDAGAKIIPSSDGPVP